MFVQREPIVNIYFSDYFLIPAERLNEYGAFNISLVSDLPLFIDPFLLFNSKKKQYQGLHNSIIKYVSFLRDMSAIEGIKPGLLKNWFYFPEIKQCWFGYSREGNSGSGLGKGFAVSLNKNLHNIFANFGQEEITRSSHLEKLCLIKDGVGRDLISDFVTNLIKSFLLEYTQTFAKQHLQKNLLKIFTIGKVKFNYETQSWESGSFELPVFENDYVLITPKDILTKDDTWINKNDLVTNFDDIVDSVSNDQLRAQIDNHFLRHLPENPKAKDRASATISVVNNFPSFIDFYIKYKEDNGEQAKILSDKRVSESSEMYINNVKAVIKLLTNQSDFYKNSSLPDSYQDARNRVLYLKDVIENKDGYRFFYIKGEPIKRENDLQIMFRLVCYKSNFDINREVNNGRGSVDYKSSMGAHDSTLIEFKLASNKKLAKNLENQVAIYEKANNTKKSIKVILFFNDAELERVHAVLCKLGFTGNKDIILIDASSNKPSASNA